MKTYFISRHAGAQEWAARQGFNAEVVAHFSPDVVNPGDIVIGTLPVHLAGDVCDRGGEYHHLVMNMPAELRGTEITADKMEELGAAIQQFQIARVS